MDWKWRGDFSPASRAEYQSIVQQLESERVVTKSSEGVPKTFHELPPLERAEVAKKRLNEYCKRAYGRVRYRNFGRARFTATLQRAKLTFSRLWSHRQIFIQFTVDKSTK